MTCSNCRLYFCYLCNEPISGYDHFSNRFVYVDLPHNQCQTGAQLTMLLCCLSAATTAVAARACCLVRMTSADSTDRWMTRSSAIDTRGAMGWRSFPYCTSSKGECRRQRGAVCSVGVVLGLGARAFDLPTGPQAHAAQTAAFTTPRRPPTTTLRAPTATSNSASIALRPFATWRNTMERANDASNIADPGPRTCKWFGENSSAEAALR